MSINLDVLNIIAQNNDFCQIAPAIWQNGDYNIIYDCELSALKLYHNSGLTYLDVEVDNIETCNVVLSALENFDEIKKPTHRTIYTVLANVANSVMFVEESRDGPVVLTDTQFIEEAIFTKTISGRYLVKYPLALRGHNLKNTIITLSCDGKSTTLSFNKNKRNISLPITANAAFRIMSNKRLDRDNVETANVEDYTELALLEDINAFTFFKLKTPISVKVRGKATFDAQKNDIVGIRMETTKAGNATYRGFIYKDKDISEYALTRAKVLEIYKAVGGDPKQFDANEAALTKKEIDEEGDSIGISIKELPVQTLEGKGKKSHKKKKETGPRNKASKTLPKKSEPTIDEKIYDQLYAVFKSERSIKKIKDKIKEVTGKPLPVELRSLKRKKEILEAFAASPHEALDFLNRLTEYNQGVDTVKKVPVEWKWAVSEIEDKLRAGRYRVNDIFRVLKFLESDRGFRYNYDISVTDQRLYGVHSLLAFIQAVKNKKLDPMAAVKDLFKLLDEYADKREKYFDTMRKSTKIKPTPTPRLPAKPVEQHPDLFNFDITEKDNMTSQAVKTISQLILKWGGKSTIRVGRSIEGHHSFQAQRGKLELVPFTVKPHIRILKQTDGVKVASQFSTYYFWVHIINKFMVADKDMFSSVHVDPTNPDSINNIGVINFKLKEFPRINLSIKMLVDPDMNQYQRIADPSGNFIGGKQRGTNMFAGQRKAVEKYWRINDLRTVAPSQPNADKVAVGPWKQQLDQLTEEFFKKGGVVTEAPPRMTGRKFYKTEASYTAPINMVIGAAYFNSYLGE